MGRLMEGILHDTIVDQIGNKIVITIECTDRKMAADWYDSLIKELETTNNDVVIDIPLRLDGYSFKMWHK